MKFFFIFISILVCSNAMALSTDLMETEATLFDMEYFSSELECTQSGNAFLAQLTSKKIMKQYVHDGIAVVVDILFVLTDSENNKQQFVYFESTDDINKDQFTAYPMTESGKVNSKKSLFVRKNNG